MRNNREKMLDSFVYSCLPIFFFPFLLFPPLALTLTLTLTLNLTVYLTIAPTLTLSVPLPFSLSLTLTINSPSLSHSHFLSHYLSLLPVYPTSLVAVLVYTAQRVVGSHSANHTVDSQSSHDLILSSPTS